MANVLHSSVTGADLHEPKGIAAATINQVYVADGAASGSWLVLRPVGEVIDYMGTTEPTGFLFCDGDTVGNASSNATARANADTTVLFDLLWAIGDTYATLAIYDSAGSASTFGASAAADFAANKAIALPDFRERVSAGWDNKQDVSRLTSGNTIDGDTPGTAGGAETFTIAKANLPSYNLSHSLEAASHTHSGSALGITGSPSLSGSQSGGLTRNLSETKTAITNTSNNTNMVQDMSWSTTTLSVSKGTLDVSGSTSSSGPHTVSGTVSSDGSDTAIGYIQPTYICTKLIFYGV